MEAPFPIVKAGEDIELLYAELASGLPALVAAQDERPVAIITRPTYLSSSPVSASGARSR